MKPTIGRLLELLVERPGRPDSEIAPVLGVDLVKLRTRLVDLKKRRLVTGPHEEGDRVTWTAWFSTASAAIAAAERSGLSATQPVLMKGWWDRLWSR
jgi:hypothetical protein